MRAIIVEPKKPNSAKLAEIAQPSPTKEQVLLEVLCVGIDGTDREINEGLYGEAPDGSDFLVMGHEAVARVSKVGEFVLGFSSGELVVPTVRRPGTCAYCRVGEVSFCPVGDYSEHGISKLHGFASDFAVSDANYLVKIPPELQKGAVLLEPMSVVEKAVTQIFLAQKRMTWMAKRALVLGAGPLGLLAAMLLRLRGFEVVCGATRAKDSLKANIVQTIGATYVNFKEKPLRSFEGKFDLIIEATGNVGVATESLYLLASNGVLCLLGVYRDIQACQDFGKVLTNIVLGNRLVIGSVNSDKIHFEMGIEDMMGIKQRFGDVLKKMLTANLSPEDFHKAFSPDKEEIKTVICFH